MIAPLLKTLVKMAMSSYRDLRTKIVNHPEISKVMEVKLFD